MNRIYSYNVFDIGQCRLKDDDNSLLSIPKLQRGQVWKPQQIELLWDSLLRNFPIGTLIVLSSDNGQQPPKGEIIDGQQRVRAIIAGFQHPRPESDCVVWVDINADNLQDRKFTIRVTNRAHPWGYELSGGALSADKKRRALEKAEINPEMPKSEWNILNFSPEGQNTLPIPLSFFLFADGADRIDSILQRCEDLAALSPVWGKYYLAKVKALEKSRFERYLNAIDKLRHNAGDTYSIPAIVIDSQEDLDLLFNRIGTQGTNITNKELAYAFMKAYWEEDSFGEVNAIRSRDIVSEEDFAQIVFRLFSSIKGLHGDITPEFVRGLHNDTNSEKVSIRQEILSAYNNKGETLDRITSIVDNWLLDCSDGDKKYHIINRSEIASKRPSLYILLLRLALIQLEGRLGLSKDYIQALAFYLHVCIWNEKAISEVYKRVVTTAGVISEVLITNALRDCISYEYCSSPVNSFRTFPALSDKAFAPNWNLDDYKNERGYDLFASLFSYGNFQSSYVLELAEHNYFNKQYSDYNPYRKDLWEDQNRPWDHDHIIPQNWIGENQIWSPFCEKWINSIGNIADIPFGINRGKQDADDWDYYYRHKDGLLFHPNDDVIHIDKHLAESGFDDQRKEFFDFTRNRFLLIVEPFLQIISRLNIHESLSETQSYRKRLMLEAHKAAPECKLYYLQNGIEYEFDEDDNFAWQQSWITMSKSIGDPERVAALTMALNEDGSFEAQCGLRKHPKMFVEQMSNRGWWASDGSFSRGKVWLSEDDGAIKVVSFYHWDPIQSFLELLSQY